MAGDTFHLELVTPQGTPWAGAARLVEAPGEEGRLGVMAGHQPCVVSLRAGELGIRDAEGRRERWEVERGFLVVTPTHVQALVRAARLATSGS
jgi:F-type H+-transporting ATPase subunit epsilon